MADQDQAYAQALQATAEVSQRQLARRNEYEKIKKGVRKTAFIVFALILTVAGICDLLTIFDLGWLISWSLPILVGYFIVRRIERINDGSQKIVEKTSEIKEELRHLLGPSANISELKHPKFNSYIWTFIRDTIITQLVELIPFVDWLPFYMGQVVKTYINMRTRYLATKKLLMQYETILGELEQAENLQVEKKMAQIYNHA